MQAQLLFSIALLAFTLGTSIVAPTNDRYTHDDSSSDNAVGFLDQALDDVRFGGVLKL